MIECVERRRALPEITWEAHLSDTQPVRVEAELAGFTIKLALRPDIVVQ